MSQNSLNGTSSTNGISSPSPKKNNNIIGKFFFQEQIGIVKKNMAKVEEKLQK
jgi:hypothetical protein